MCCAILIEAKGVTLDQLAEGSGVPASDLDAILAGDREAGRHVGERLGA